MPKEPYRVEKNAMGDGPPPPIEVLQQKDVVKQQLGMADNARLPSRILLREDEGSDNPTLQPIVRPVQKVKLTYQSPHVSFVLEIPVYEIDMQEHCVNLEVPVEFTLSSTGRMDFILDTGSTTHEVVFLGVTVNFKSFKALSFVRK